jgi:hypothetical protein
MRFDLIRPCPRCPFRSDIRPFLRPDRAEEIGDAITQGQQTFTCHETTVPCDDEDGEAFGEMQDGPKAQHCAGALILLEKLEQPNQMMRWMERLGQYDRTKLDMDAPVFDDIEQFIEAQERCS